MLLTRLTRASAIALLLMVPAGCANDGRGAGAQIGDLFGEDEANLTPAERRLREDSRVFNETILGGVAVGALAGAAVGALLGAALGGGRGAAKGAIAGGVLGGVAGGLDGWRVALKQEAARKQVREIDLATEQVLAENRRMQQSIDNMDQVLSQSRRSVRGARTGYRQGKVTADEVRAVENRARNNAQYASQTIEGQENRLDEIRQQRSALQQEGQNTRAMDRQIADMERKLENARRERDALVADLDTGRVIQ